MPRQDGRIGRDAASGVSGQLAKVGGGTAGFDFSRICWSGAVEGTSGCTGTLVANTTATASGTPATDWACTRDNVTGLVWSLQTKPNGTWDAANAVTYPDAGHNTATRCGYSSGWRMPTHREMLSIVNNDLSAGPTIDAAYFPTTASVEYWTGSLYGPTSPASQAWTVSFGNGEARYRTRSGSSPARLVVDSAP